jgi:hypothetical protein
VSQEGPRSKKGKAALIGTWRIVETELWDVEALDLVKPAHVTFEASGLGELQLIAIGAAIDYRVSERDGMPLVEFSWSGYDDSDRASGRGSARLESGGVLKGKLFIHQGDESAFIAYREAEAENRAPVSRGKPSPPPRRRRRRPRR